MTSYYKKFNDNKLVLTNILIVISFIMFLRGYRLILENSMIISLMLLYFGVVLRLSKKSILLFSFLSSFMIFLVTRSFIDITDGVQWFNRWDYNYTIKGLTILYISLVSLFTGYSLSFKSFKSNRLKLESKFTFKKKNLKILSLIVLVLYLVTYIFAFYIEFDKFIFMRGRLYEDFYLYYNPSFNLIIKLLGKLNFYFFIFLLSLRPAKKLANSLLLLNVFVTLPTLMIGQRGSFMLSVILAAVYYILMQINYNDEKWISKRLVVITIILVPLLLILLSVINELRHGSDFNFNGVFSTLKSFVHKQGVTFDAFMNGIVYEDKIRSLTGGKNYLFGEFIDFLKYNPLSVAVFNTTPLPSGNNVIKALTGNSYAHILSYVSHHSYLKGFGFGSSYILEAFHTYGMIGIVAVNMFIGVLINRLESFFKKSVFNRFITLVILTDLLYLPRQPFSTLLMVVIHPYFIIFVVMMIGIYFIINKCSSGVSSVKLDNYYKKMFIGGL